MKKTIFFPLGALLLFVIVFSGRNIKNRCRQISGIVSAIYEDGTRDAVIRLEGHQGLFYINRGLENTFSLDLLVEKLKGREVTIVYADNQTPLGVISECRHISELYSGEETVYSESRQH